MPYPILDPHQEPTLRPLAKGLCALSIMAKAPRAGKVKTRLSPPLTLAQTAALNVCFLKDTAVNLNSVQGARGILCYTPVGEEEAFRDLLPSSFALLAQRGDDFGERLLAAATDLLACGFSSVCLIDSDSPTVPAAAFQMAVDLLAKPGERVVLGPSHDGGYYLIGLKSSRPEPFTGISWSTGDVAQETRTRCREAGLEVCDLPVWYDIDDARTLAMLNDELLCGRAPDFTTVEGYAASHTREFLLELEAPRDVVTQGERTGEASR